MDHTCACLKSRKPLGNVCPPAFLSSIVCNTNSFITTCQKSLPLSDDKWGTAFSMKKEKLVPGARGLASLKSSDTGKPGKEYCQPWRACKKILDDAPMENPPKPYISEFFKCLPTTLPHLHTLNISGT